MRYILFVIFLFIASNLFAQSARELLDKADKLKEKKKFDEALTIYNRILKDDSTHYHAYLQRGLLFNDMDEMQKSYDDYSKAAAMYPDSALAYHYRAILLFRMLYTEEAIYDNTKAIELAKDDSLRMICFSNRGNAKQQKRDFQGAYEDYSKAYLLNSNDIGVINNMATSLDELGRRDEAIEFFKKIITIDSSFIGPYVNIGFQYTQMGKYKEAITYFDKALLIEKDEPLTLNNRGLAKYHLRDYLGALQDINISIGKYPGNAYAYKNRALVYIGQGKIEKACKDLEEAQKLEFTKQYGEEVNELQRKYCSRAVDNK
jgi:tetratricopeptide (TPR) repeat protein